MGSIAMEEFDLIANDALYGFSEIWMFNFKVYNDPGVTTHVPQACIDPLVTKTFAGHVGTFPDPSRPLQTR